jgi:methylenetetrahydrofolate reductase (NADPH)
MSIVRPQLFNELSLETTARGASEFLRADVQVPEGTSVNIAFLGCETFDERLAAIETIRDIGARPRPIISARRLASPGVLRSFLERAVQVGKIRGVFVVGGDPSVAQGPFSDSMDVINGRFLDDLDIETVGVAGYPEGHPRISGDVLWDYLRRKVDALMAKGFGVEITTQLSFDVDAVISWIEQVRNAGIHVPIYIGIPSPSSVPGILKFAGKCHVLTSADIVQRYGWKIASLFGSIGPDRFLATLLKRIAYDDLGVVRLHLFPLGDLAKVVQWIRAYEARSSA